MKFLFSFIISIFEKKPKSIKGGNFNSHLSRLITTCTNKSDFFPKNMSTHCTIVHYNIGARTKQAHRLKQLYSDGTSQLGELNLANYVEEFSKAI